MRTILKAEDLVKVYRIGKVDVPALRGVSLDAPQAWERAILAMAEDYQPIGDMRASAEYRLAAAQALLRKALMEVASGQSAATRLAGLRGEAA